MARIEWVVGIIRAGEDFQEHGDPYTFAATVSCQGDHALLRGAVGQLNHRRRRELVECLRANGMRTLGWEREDGRQAVFDIRGKGQ